MVHSVWPIVTVCILCTRSLDIVTMRKQYTYWVRRYGYCSNIQYATWLLPSVHILQVGLHAINLLLGHAILRHIRFVQARRFSRRFCHDKYMRERKTARQWPKSPKEDWWHQGLFEEGGKMAATILHIAYCHNSHTAHLHNMQGSKSVLLGHPGDKSLLLPGHLFSERQLPYLWRLSRRDCQCSSTCWNIDFFLIQGMLQGTAVCCSRLILSVNVSMNRPLHRAQQLQWAVWSQLCSLKPTSCILIWLNVAPVGLLRIQVSLKASQLLNIFQKKFDDKQYDKNKSQRLFQRTWLHKFPWSGVDQMIQGVGGGGVYANFFSLLTRNKPFFCFSGNEISNFFPPI